MLVRKLVSRIFNEVNYCEYFYKEVKGNLKK